MMKINYKQQIIEMNKRLSQLKQVKIVINFTNLDLIKTDQKVKNIIAYKKQETSSSHQFDNHNEFKRWFTGMLGELAIEKALHLKFADSSVGNSYSYDVPDMIKSHYKIGIKTCCYPNFPVVNRNLATPQIFVMLNKLHTKAAILGIATPEILAVNQLHDYNARFVLDHRMLDRKTAFTDLQLLKPLSSNMLVTYKK